MSELLFYEKPGCIGNHRQQALLLSQGHAFVVRDLLSEPWSPGRLRPFFGDRPVAEWFNTGAPRVKSGEIDIGALDEAAALALMVAEPLLICRPLLEYGEARQCGFVPGPVMDRLGLVLDPQQDLQSCPLDVPEPACGEPARGEPV